MPQMMPINWIMLTIFFMIIFLLFNIMNYYNFNINNKNFSSKMKLIKFNNIFWKW